MKFRLTLLGVCVLLVAGCQHHPLVDYRPLDQAGMWSGSIEQLKAQNVSDAEIAQVVKLKQIGIGDDTCVALISGAHAKLNLFTSADSVGNLAGAGFKENQILEIAGTGHLESISGDLVTLRLIGISENMVKTVLHRRLQGMPTMGSGAIAHLKNTGLSESQILQRINAGQTDEQAEAEATARERTRNHANTGFVRVHGRKPR
ncbi:MAG TPA: hypothetical protein VGI16_05650 [Candidatus Acidoferrum sp.]|jgi:hypothetical protein